MDPVADPKLCSKVWRGRCPAARKSETDRRGPGGRSTISRTRGGDSRNQQSSGLGRRTAWYGIPIAGECSDPQPGDRGKHKGAADVVILSPGTSKKVTWVGQ